MNEEKTLYEIITNLKNENTLCILTVGRFVAITFTPADMCEINRFKQAFFTTTDLSKLTVSVKVIATKRPTVKMQRVFSFFKFVIIS